MAKRGRKQTAGLRWHANQGQWYRVIDGKQKRFGPVGRKGKTADESVKAAAEAEWHRYEAARLNEVTSPILAPVIRNVGLAFDMLNRKGAAEVAMTGATTSEEVEEIRASLAAGLAALSPQTVKSDPSGPTCGMVVDAYLDFLRKNRSRDHFQDATTRLRKSDSKRDKFPRWLEVVGANTPIRGLTRAHFIKYRDMVRDGVKDGKLSQSSANKFFNLVKGAFTRANLEKGYTTPDIPVFCKLLETSTTVQTDKAIFTVPDFTTILESLDTQWTALALLALNAGLSNTDVAEITWDRIIWDGEYMDYPRGKNKRLRRTPLWPRTIKALKEWKAESTAKGDLIFHAEEGSAFIVYSDKGKNDLLAQSFARKMNALDMSYTFGIFRKSGPTVAKRVVDADTIKMFLGDASNAVWRKHYVMTAPENVKAVTDEIQRYYFTAPKKPKGKKK